MKSDIAPKMFKYNVPGEKKRKRVKNYLTGKYEYVDEDPVEEKFDLESPTSPEKKLKDMVTSPTKPVTHDMAVGGDSRDGTPLADIGLAKNGN